MAPCPFENLGRTLTVRSMYIHEKCVRLLYTYILHSEENKKRKCPKKVYCKFLKCRIEKKKNFIYLYHHNFLASDRRKCSPEKKLDMTEMRMLTWTCGFRSMDIMRNEIIRGTTRKVGEISKKVQGGRLK